MPSLSEILNDPNYVNANSETKEAIFQKYAPLDENYSAANPATQFAIRDKFGLAQQGGIGSLASSLAPTANPILGLVSRAASLAGSGIEGVARVGEYLGDKLEGILPLSGLTPEQVQNQRQLEPIFKIAEATKRYAEGINYQPSTTLGDLGDNPLKVLPFIAERIISSTPDMAAAVLASPAYITSRTNEILNDRLKNDEKDLKDATVADVSAALVGAVAESKLEKFATKRILKGQPIAGKSASTRIFKETGIQSGTEGAEELIAGIAGSLGTKKGLDARELAEGAIEGAIVGAGLGGGTRSAREYFDAKGKKKAEEDAAIAEAAAKRDAAVTEALKDISPTETFSRVESPTPLDDPDLEFTGSRDVNGEKTYSYIKRTPKEVAPEVAPEPELFGSREPLPQEILDQGYRLVEQREEDGEPLYVYVKEEPVAQPVQEVVQEPAAQPTPEKVAQPAQQDIAQQIEIENIYNSLGPNAKDLFFVSTSRSTDPSLGLEDKITKDGVTYYIHARSLTNYLYEQSLKNKEAPAQPPLDPNVEAQLAAEQPDVESMVPNEPPPPPKVKAQRAPKEPAAPKVYYGVDAEGNVNVPLTEGGAPFKTRKEADDVKKLQPTMRVQKVKDGWVLADKSEKELEAEKVKIKNLQGPSGKILSAHEFIASLGGLNKKEAAEMNVDLAKSNVKLGNKWLYAGKNGLSASEAAEKLKEAGYIDNEDNRSVYKVISDSLDSPIYSTYDADAIAEQRFAEESQRRAEEQAQREADAMLEAEEISRENAQRLMYSRASVSNVTPEDTAAAEFVANATKSKIVYQNGPIALFAYTSPNTGDPLYFPAKNKSVVQNANGIAVLDQVSDKTNLFTQQELNDLKKIRDDIEAAEKAKYDADKFLQFKDGVAFSENISPKLRDLFVEWKKLLKLDQDIYLATNQDVLNNQDKYSWILRRIPNAAGQDNPGSTQILDANTRYILVDGNLSEDRIIETLAHEMGHIHEKQSYDNALPEMKTKIRAEYEKWRKASRSMTTRDFVDSMRAKETAAGTIVPSPLSPAKDLQRFDSYWTSFSEWYADQVARWATTSEKPMSSVDKFFSKVAQTLRNFFSFIQNKGFLPNQTFAKYMDDITSPTIVANDPIVPMDKNGQLPLFSIGKLTMAPTIPSTGTPRVNITGAPINGTWTAAPETTLTPWIYKIQDKQIDLKDAQKQIEKTVGKIDDAMNAYRKETLYYGRVADQTEQFLNKELKPLLQEMLDKKISLDTVDKYLQALHAKERNESIAKRIGGMPDGGAGISTADAQAYLASLSPQEQADLQSISDRVRKIIAGTQEIEVKGGLETKSKIDGWNKAWPNYVPLFRDEIDYVNSGSGMGQGFSTRGSSSKRAVGSDKPVKEIIASVAEQRQKAIVRSEKARVGRALYALAIANPNPDYWLPIDPKSKEDIKLVEQMLLDYGFDPGDIAQLIQNMAQEPRTGSIKRIYNPVTKNFDEVVRYDINTQNRYSSNVLPIRIDGEDKFLFFNPSNDRAKRMAESIKNLDAEQLGEVTQTIGNVTRFIAALSTQYNPIFGAWNFARDVQGAALNLTTTPLKDKKAEVVKGAFKAMRGIYKEIRARREGKEASGYYSDLYRDFESQGGKTGFINQFNNLDKKGTIVERELKGLTQGKIKGAASAVGGWLSDYNDVLENAVRLSAYEQGLAKGLSKEEAAEIAKNLTVNFNRKGAKTAGLGALYAFFNSAVQGTARLYETLRGPSGKKIIAGGFLLGAFQAALLAMAGFDEDEPSEFIKQKNFIIPTLDGGYVMIPMPLGFNILPNTGRIISEIAFGSKKSGSRKIGDLMEAVVSSFNPLGGGNIVQMAMPTVLDPIANVAINRDSFGRPISKEDRAMNPSPGYLRSRESAGVISKGIAEFLNYVSGGTEFNKGAFSPTGDDINYIVGQYLGGVGREVMRAKEFVTSIGKEEPFEPYKVPIVGKVYGDINAPASVANKFYLNVKQMAEHENEIKGRKGSGVSEYMRENPDARLYQTANRLENEISKLNKTKAELLKRDAPEERIRRIEDQKLRMMKQFNDQVRKLQ